MTLSACCAPRLAFAPIDNYRCLWNDPGGMRVACELFRSITTKESVNKELLQRILLCRSSHAGAEINCTIRGLQGASTFSEPKSSCPIGTAISVEVSVSSDMNM
jgi:hypothetical protein